MAKPKEKAHRKHGHLRERHEAHEKPRSKQRLNLQARIDLLNSAFERAIRDAECDDLDELAQCALMWCAELAVVHQPDIEDAAIENAKLIFPQQPVMRVFEIVSEFHANNMHLTPDEIVAFVAGRLTGSLPATA